MEFTAGSRLLHGRYELTRECRPDDGVCQSWICFDEVHQTDYLAKIWPFESEEPDPFQRALWDSELRTLYRIGSSPAAETMVLVIKYAAVDKDNRCFVMILEAPGYQILAHALNRKGSFPWLLTANPADRRKLWESLLRLAKGLKLLHDQNYLHRNVGAETVYFNEQDGIASLRLGGFEWSVRLGNPAAGEQPPLGWSSPPEQTDGTLVGFRPETDWYAFGMLLARCFLNLERFSRYNPIERHEKILSQIKRTDTDLSDLELSVLGRLLAKNYRERLCYGPEIIDSMVRIVDQLKMGAEETSEEGSLVLVINPRSQGFEELLAKAEELGFNPGKDDADDVARFVIADPDHEYQLARFLTHDFENAEICAQGPDIFVLIGARLVVRIHKFASSQGQRNSGTRTWKMAFCPGLGQLRWNDGGSQDRKLPVGEVAVKTVDQLKTDRRLQLTARNWEPFLPSIDPGREIHEDLERFRDFLRCTNQFELLMRDAEVFPYRIKERILPEKKSGDPKLAVEKIAVCEEEHDRPVLSCFRVKGGMVEFVQQEIESGKPYCQCIVLTGPDEGSLGIPYVDNKECWIVEKVDTDKKEIVLRRSFVGEGSRPAPERGYLRTFGLQKGQITLISKAKECY